MRPMTVVPVEKKSPAKTFAIVTAVLALIFGGWGIYQWQMDRGAVSRMQELISAGSYGVAENVFHEHYDDLRSDPRALALIPEMLRKRREAERDEENFKVQFDPSFRLEPSKFMITFREKTDSARRTQRYLCVFERADDATFEGYLDWPDAGIRAAIRGIRDGNHLVFWDYKVLSGNVANYTIDDKKNAYIVGERIVGTDGPFLAQIEGTLKK
jgi:hypothetical protein